MKKYLYGTMTLPFISAYLKSCNVIDTMDVFLKVFKASEEKDELKKELKSTNIMFLSSPTIPIEVNSYVPSFQQHLNISICDPIKNC